MKQRSTSIQIQFNFNFTFTIKDIVAVVTWARLMVRRSVVTVRRHTSPPPDTENQLDSWAVLEGLTA